VDLSTGFGNENVIDRLEFACSPEEFRQKMSVDPDYSAWHYEKLEEDEKPAGFVEPPRQSPRAIEAEADAVIAGMRKELLDRHKVQKQKLEARKAKRERVHAALKKSLERRLEMAISVTGNAGAGEAFRLWKRTLMEWKRHRADRMERERQDRLAVLGEEFARFSMACAATTKKQVLLTVQINKFTNPNYFKVTIQNEANAEKQDDIVVIKILALPGSLKSNERDPKKIKHVFVEKLKVVW